MSRHAAGDMAPDTAPGHDVLIRPATREDLPQILAIHNDAIVHTTAVYDLEPVDLADREHWFEAHADAGFPVIIACAPNSPEQVLGYAAYGPYNPKAGYAATVEHSVYVTPGHHGRGLGTRLLTRLIEIADARGIHAMIALIDADNAASIRLHEHLGFTRAGRLDQAGRKFGRWLDVVLMQRLAPGTAHTCTRP